VQRVEDEEFFLAREEELGLPTIAVEVRDGNLGAPAAYRDALSELKDDIGTTIARRFFGEERDAATSPEGQLLRAWQEIRPTVEQFPDLTTGGVDMTAFFVAKRDAFEAFRKVAPEAAKAIEDRLSVQDPDENSAGTASVSYWGVGDLVWQDYKDDVAIELPGVTTPQELAEAAAEHGGEKASKIKNFLQSRVNEIHLWMRDQDGELDARLRFWGYVSTLRRPEGARNPSDTPGGKAWAVLYPDMDMPRFTQP
jgi:hypothetical protein